MIAVQILSDLHLESPKAYDIFEVEPRAPCLALLGDIGNVVPHREECLAFLTRQLRQFQTVLFVPGNHEAYGGSWPESLAVLKEFEHSTDQAREGPSASELGKFVVLDRGLFELPASDGCRRVLLGCSLFSYVPPQSEMAVEMGLQDFFQTSSWSVRDHNEAHARDLAWLNEQVDQIQCEDSNVQIIMCTHWSPTTDPRSLDPRHAGSKITPGFATDLSGELCFKSANVVLWAFGHTHYNCDFTIDRIDAEPLRLVTNQRGYYFSQAEGFFAEKIIEM